MLLRQNLEGRYLFVKTNGTHTSGTLVVTFTRRSVQIKRVVATMYLIIAFCTVFAIGGAIYPTFAQDDGGQTLPPYGYAPDFAPPPIWIVQAALWDPSEEVLEQLERDCYSSAEPIVFEGNAVQPQQTRWCLSYRARLTEDEIVALTEEVYQSLHNRFEIGSHSEFEVAQGQSMVAAFVEAQRAWLNYRGYQCEYEASTWWGTGAIDARAACFDSMNTERAAELRTFVESMPVYNE